MKKNGFKQIQQLKEKIMKVIVFFIYLLELMIVVAIIGIIFSLITTTCSNKNISKNQNSIQEMPKEKTITELFNENDNNYDFYIERAKYNILKGDKSYNSSAGVYYAEIAQSYILLAKELREHNKETSY